MVKVCQWCGKEFLTSKDSQVNCSKECRVKIGQARARDAAREKREKTAAEKEPDIGRCERCGKEFVRARKNQRFCGAQCQAAWNRETKRKLKDEAPKEPEEPLLVILEEEAPQDVETEDEDMGELERMRGYRISANEPRIVPRPTCRLERDVLEARRAGAKSYGYYKARKLLGW